MTQLNFQKQKRELEEVKQRKREFEQENKRHQKRMEIFKKLRVKSLKEQLERDPDWRLFKLIWKEMGLDEDEIEFMRKEREVQMKKCGLI